MSISRQPVADALPSEPELLDQGSMELEKGPKARTRRLMLDCAIQLMQNGITPSVSYVSEEAGVSRATAYRYFPNQAALVQQVIKHALGPIMVWRSDAEDVEVRVTELLEFSMPRIEAFEATFRAVLQLSLVQMAQRTAGTLDESEYQFKRGHRIALLARALEPLSGTIPDEDYQQLLTGLSVIFGIEAIAVMKDINGIRSPKTTELVVWAAQAMVRQTLQKQEAAS